MAWTATAAAPRTEDGIGVARISVTFTDGVHKVIQDFVLASDLDFQSFPATVDARRLQLALLYADAAGFVPGLVTFTPVADTPAQTAQKTWLTNYQNWKLLKANLAIAVANGLSSPVQADVDAAWLVVKTNYLAAYGPLLQ